MLHRRDALTESASALPDAGDAPGAQGARALPAADRLDDVARRNLTSALRVSTPEVAVAGCGDARQAVVWAVRRCHFAENRTVAHRRAREVLTVHVAGLASGDYRVTTWRTELAETEQMLTAMNTGVLKIEVAFARGLAIAVRALD